MCLWLSLFPALTHRNRRVAGERRSTAISELASPSPSRPVYPYSVIRGGAYSAAELIEALDRDPVAASHYLVFRRSSVRITKSSFPEPVFLSYRVGSAIYWTSRPVHLPPGETLLTDGQNYARARCGNRISQTPQTPVNDTEPAPETLDTPHPPANTIVDLNTWSEDRLTAGGTPFVQTLPALASPVSAVPEWGLQSGTIPSWWLISPPNGSLSLPVTGSPTLGLLPPGGTGPVIEPNPIPGLLLPPPPGFTPPATPAPPVPSTPPVVAIVPPNSFPPEIWPPAPTFPIGPGFPQIPGVPGAPWIPITPQTPIQPWLPGVPGIPITPQTPIQPTGPVQPVPEPALLLPTLLACAAFAVAKFLRSS
jgi:hypothetical protein